MEGKTYSRIKNSDGQLDLFEVGQDTAPLGLVFHKFNNCRMEEAIEFILGEKIIFELYVYFTGDNFCYGLEKNSFAQLPKDVFFNHVVSPKKNIVFKNSNYHFNFIFPESFSKQVDHKILSFKLFIKNYVHNYFNRKQTKTLSKAFESFKNTSSEKKRDEISYFYSNIEILSDLINNLKHELSNPLFGITLATNTLEYFSHNPEIKETIHSMGDAAKKCQGIIDNFCNIYTSQKAEKVNLAELIQEAFTLSKSRTRHIHKELYCTEIVPPVTICNKTALFQVFFNLLINAAQAFDTAENQIKNEKPHITVQIEQLKGNFVINFNDNGPGISDKIRDKIFSPFFTTKKNGNGLGLSICQELLKKENGTIILQPSVGPGSTFTVSIPIIE